MSNILIVICSIFALQSLFGFMQIRYYQQYMHKMAQQYAGLDGYRLFSCMEKKRLGASAIALIVVDENNLVKQCQVLHGHSVLSKFKHIKQFCDLTAEQVIGQLNGKQQITKLKIWEQAIIKTALMTNTASVN